MLSEFRVTRLVSVHFQPHDRLLSRASSTTLDSTCHPRADGVPGPRLSGSSLHDRYIFYIDGDINIANRYIRSVNPMPITLKRTLVKIGGSLRLTIPPEIAEMLKLAEGDEVEFSATNGDVMIRKAKH